MRCSRGMWGGGGVECESQWEDVGGEWSVRCSRGMWGGEWSVRGSGMMWGGVECESQWEDVGGEWSVRCSRGMWGGGVGCEMKCILATYTN